MRRRWKMLLGALAVLAVLLALNAVALNSQTEPAEVTAPEGRIVELDAGDVQVVDQGPTDPRAEPGVPLVLVHCYTCSLRWWDRVAPQLATDRRVIRLDLLGHGGSEKPPEGYTPQAQAALIAELLIKLEVEGAVVAGHSLGAIVSTALTQSSSELVDRVVLIGMAPNLSDFGDLDLASQISRWPVIGPALWRVVPDAIWRSGAESEAFAPDFDPDEGFDDPDQPVEDLRSMTYSAYETYPETDEEFTSEQPLTERLLAAQVPAMVIMGSEDRVFDGPAVIEAYEEALPGVRVALLDGVGHSPNVEAPQQTAELIADFASRADSVQRRTERPPRRSQR